MNVTPETRLALDPQICLRNDVDRAVLITRPKPLADKNYIYRLLHPSEAIILALMDGDRTIRDLGELWAELTDKTPEQGAAEVGKIVEYYTTGDRVTNGILMKVNESNRPRVRQYDPRDFVIPARQVNVKDPRMRRPYMVYYLPTLFCPQKCIYCYAHTAPKPENGLIRLERLREVFAELKTLDVEVIQMSGGEAFARKDIFEIIEAAGLGNVSWVSLTPYGRSLFCHSDELFVTPDDLARVQEEVERRKGLHPHMRITMTGGAAPRPDTEEERILDWKGRAYCTANRHGFVILPDGKVTVCEELYDHPSFVIGDLTRQSVMEMWNSPEALALHHPKREDVPDGICRTCSAFEECNEKGRCWRDVMKAYGWDRPHYPDPRCPWAPEGNRLS